MSQSSQPNPPVDPSTDPATANPTAGSESSLDPYADITALVRRRISRSKLASEALRVIGRYFKTPYATIHLKLQSEVLEDHCHFGTDNPTFWKPNVEAFLTDAVADGQPRARTLKSRSNATKVAFLATPLFDTSGAPAGAIALVVAPIQEAQVIPALTKLESLARLLSVSLEFIQMQPSGGGGSGMSQGAAQAGMKTAACDSPIELAFTITNELRNKLACEQVILGMVKHARVNIISISGLDEVKKQSPGVVCMTGAFEECLDAGMPIVQTQRGGWAGDEEKRNYRLHGKWHGIANGDAVASVPLFSGDEIVAVLGLRFRRDHDFEAERLDDIRKRVEPYAASLRLAMRARRNLAGHCIDAARETVGYVMEPNAWGRKIAAATAIMASLWVGFGSMDHEIGVDAAITAAESRHIANPIDAILLTAPKVEGDPVKAGEVLAQFDQRDLLQEREQLQAELAVADINTDIARASDSPYEVTLAESKAKLVRTKLDIVNRRIEQATVVSPIDGIIVSGDLRRRIGGVLQRGEPLYEIAPMDRWTLELKIPDSVSDEVEAQLDGEFASFARPDQLHGFRISRVKQSARPLDARNVFIAEADIRSNEDWIKPGMEGIAKVNIGQRRVWWIFFHKAIDYLRVNFWI
ncbi:MAG: efflux RND transporter periplasmic adaptor subunit [Phycisphaerae bacterium]